MRSGVVASNRLDLVTKLVNPIRPHTPLALRIHDVMRSWPPNTSRETANISSPCPIPATTFWVSDVAAPVADVNTCSEAGEGVELSTRHERWLPVPSHWAATGPLVTSSGWRMWKINVQLSGSGPGSVLTGPSPAVPSK